MPEPLRCLQSRWLKTNLPSQSWTTQEQQQKAGHSAEEAVLFSAAVASEVVLLKEAAEEEQHTNEPANKVAEEGRVISTTTIEVVEAAEVDVSAGATMTSLSATAMPRSTSAQIGP